MGGINLLLFTADHQFINRDFLSPFFNIKSRGPTQTSHHVESTVSLANVRGDVLRRNLTRSEISAYKQYHVHYSYHRLAINDTSPDASQPFEDPIPHKIDEYPALKNRPTRRLMCNGEIYNYQKLIDDNKFTDADLQSSCDVEVVLPTYIKHGLEPTLGMLDGEFSFVLTENIKTYRLKDVNIFAVRDPLGHRPLYMLKANNKSLFMFVTELKAIPQVYFGHKDYTITEVPAGAYWSFNNSIVQKSANEFVRYHDWNDYRSLDTCRINTINPSVLSSTYNAIEQALVESVGSRAGGSAGAGGCAGVGVLLDGSFDSSVVLSTLTQSLVDRGHDFVSSPIYAFTFGSPSDENVMLSQNCVDFLEKKHNVTLHHHIINVDDEDLVINATEKVVYLLESYDTTTMSKAIQYYLLFNYIKSHSPVNVILTGKGLNELCGDPRITQGDDATFQNRSIKMIKHLSKYDLICFDKIGGHFGFELRHPLLAESFVKVILDIHPKLKRPEIYKASEEKINKYIIRKSMENNYLPTNVLWSRDANTKKNKLRKIILDYCEKKYNDKDFFQFVNANDKISSSKIRTKDAMHFLKLFMKSYTSMLHVIPKYKEELLD